MSETRRIDELTPATHVDNNDLFVLEQNGIAKKLTGEILKQYSILDILDVHIIELAPGAEPTVDYNPSNKTLTLGFPKNDNVARFG